MQSTRYSCDILTKPQFSRHIFEKSSDSNLMKIRSLGAEFFHADGRTKLIVTFHSFTNANKYYMCANENVP
jgi:hypothetical protein